MYIAFVQLAIEQHSNWSVPVECGLYTITVNKMKPNKKSNFTDPVLLSLILISPKLLNKLLLLIYFIFVLLAEQLTLFSVNSY